MKLLFLILLLLASISFGQSSMLSLMDDAGYDSDAKLYFDAMTTPLSAETKSKINTFVKMLKDSLQITSLSQKFDVMYLLANETAEAGLKNLVKRSNDATAVNSPTFTQWEGFQGNGSSYINTNYNPATQGIIYGQNNAHVSIYCRSDLDGLGMDWGSREADDNPRSEISLSYSGTTLYGTINSTGIGGRFIVANTNSQGFYISNRSGTNSGKLYKNGVAFSTLTQASATPNYNYYISAINIEGTAGNYQNRQYAFWTAGSSLSDTEARKLTNCVEWYMDSNGKGIIP